MIFGRLEELRAVVADARHRDAPELSSLEAELADVMRRAEAAMARERAPISMQRKGPA